MDAGDCSALLDNIGDYLHSAAFFLALIKTRS